MKTREQSVKDAIKSIKQGHYKGTYIKVELEGHLERNYEEDNYDSEYYDCPNCDGRGTFTCECEIDPLPEVETCDDCGGEGWVNCSDCDGEGRIENDSYSDSSYGDNYCLDFIMGNIPEKVKQRTVYANFVYDGSCDSELEITVPLDHPEDVIEYIKAFKLLGDDIGNGIDIRGSGMHITILRSPDGEYPSGNGEIEDEYFDNFKTQMNKLMPALVLLASEDHKSRRLHPFRLPRVGEGDHSSAVDIACHGDSGCLEWRVFETCYDHPEMFYDYLCVIAKGLEFYGIKRVNFGRTKLGVLEFYDSPSEYGLHKYFKSEKLLKALDLGLPYLCPDHRTPAECKRLRNFTVRPQALERKRAKLYQLVESEWPEYQKTRKQKEDQAVNDYVERKVREMHYGLTSPIFLEPGETPEQAMERVKKKARVTKKIREAWANDARKFHRETNPVTKKAYLNRQLRRHMFRGDRITLRV